MTSTSYETSVLSETQPRLRIAVLGGGVSGVTLAGELARNDSIDVTLFEKDPILGGLHRSAEIDGCSYDIGTFVFSKDHELFVSFPEVERGFRAVTLDSAAIRKPGSIDRFPVSLAGYVRDFGWGEAILSGIDLLLHRLNPRKPSTLPEHIARSIGRRFYVQSGLKRYVERLYHMDDTNIDILFAKQRMDMLANQASLKNALVLLMPWLGRARRPDESECWVRPAGGFPEVYGAIRRRLERDGVQVLLGTPVQSIAKVQHGFAVRFGGRVELFDRVVSTIPIPQLAPSLGMNLEARFSYMKLVSLFYRFRGDAGFDHSVLYNYTPRGLWKRVTRYSEFYGRRDGDEYFTVEATALDSSEQEVSRLCEDFERHVRELGLFQGRLWCQGRHVTEHAYPLFHRDEVRKLDEARQRIRAIGIDLVGRQGNFEYISSMKTALKAKALARGLQAEVVAAR